MMKKVSLILLVVFITGCASVNKLSTSDKNSIRNVSLSHLVIEKGAYQKPDGTSSHASETAAYAIGGAIPVLIGFAIDAAVMSHQQKKFELKNKHYFARVGRQINNNYPGKLHSNIRNALATNRFFGTRLNANSSNRFLVNLTNYGLSRVKKVKDQTYLGFQSRAQISFKKSGSEKPFFQKNYYAMSKSSYKLSDLALNPSLLEQIANESTGQIIAEFRKDLNAMTAK